MKLGLFKMNFARIDILLLVTRDEIAFDNTVTPLLVTVDWSRA